MVLTKFAICDDGFLRNPRLEKEREKQTTFRESRAKNAKKRWEKENNDDALASTVHNGSTCKTHALQSSIFNLQTSSSPTPSRPPPPKADDDGDDWGEAYPTVIADRMGELQKRLNALNPSWAKRPHFSAKELQALSANAKAWLDVSDEDWALLTAFMFARIPDEWRKDPRDFFQPDNRLGLIGIGPSSILSVADKWAKACKRHNVPTGIPNAVP
jgi:hypothetical protein